MRQKETIFNAKSSEWKVPSSQVHRQALLISLSYWLACCRWVYWSLGFACANTSAIAIAEKRLTDSIAISKQRYKLSNGSASPRQETHSGDPLKSDKTSDLMPSSLALMLSTAKFRRSLELSRQKHHSLNQTLLD